MSSESQPARVVWIDVAKAIGIVLIVAGHANRSVSRTDGLAWNEALRFADSLLYSFHVPLFFVLAGASAALARSGLRNALGSLVLGVVVPYLIWSAIWIFVKATLPAEYVNQPFELREVAKILWAPIDHFWFLYHLIAIRLLWLAAEMNLRESARHYLLLTLVGMAVVFRVAGADWVASAHFLENAVFFGLGLLLLPYLKLEELAPRFIGWALASTLLFLVAFWLNHTLGWSGLTLGVSLLGVAAVVFLVLELELRLPRSWIDAMAYVGQASLVIFLVHGFAIGAARAVLKKMDMLTPETLIGVGTIAGVVIPLIAYAGAKNLSHWSNVPIMTWIGWGRLRRPRTLVPTQA